MIVRELLTLLGFTVDQASYSKAAKAYDSLQGKLIGAGKAAQSLGQGKAGQGMAAAAQGAGALGQALGMVQRFAAQAGLSMMVKSMVDLASNANETANVIESVFGKDRVASIEAWSVAQGAAMGRSKYSLQQYVSGLGAVLGPVTESTARAQEMAQQFAQLSVDLGSFFNTSDEDAMRALRSGLTGEYESLKRYGVVLNDATLTEIAHKKGIRKKITQMSVAEKTELRYAAILERTKAAQGDASKTLDGFANSTKAFHENIKELKTDMGKAVLPQVNKLLKFAREGVTWFNKLRQGTKLLESAMYTLGAVAGILALEFYGAFILPALAVGALILVIDELWSTLEGGDTYLRDFLEWLLGVEGAEKFIQGVRDGIASIRSELEGLDGQGIWETFKAGADNAGLAVQLLIEKVIELLSWMHPVGLAWKAIKFGAQKAGIMDPDVERAMAPGMDAPIATSIADKIALQQADQQQQIQADVARRRAERAAAQAERERERKYGPRVYPVTPEMDFGAEAMVPYASGMGFQGSVAAPAAAGAGAAGGGGTTVINNASPIININGDPAVVKKVVGETLDARNKRDAAAVGGRGRQ